MTMKKLNAKFFGVIFLLLLFSSSLFAQFDANDPSGRSPNARVIGLGRAFVGLADDSAALYFNPAGIARKTTWDLSSMSGKFMEDYNFLSFSGYYPTNFGVIGIGYGGYNIGGAYATTTLEGSDPSDPIYVIDYSTPQISNYNNVLVLSYGSGLDRFLGKYLGWSDKVDVGLSLKLFSAGLSGDHITNGFASGHELDAGLMYRPVPFFNLGLAMQNLLTADMGGKLTYISGHTETYPAVLKIGTMLKVLGNENALRSLNNQELAVMLDFDSKVTIPGEPLLYHLGLEWTPHPIVSLRTGIDQSSADDGTGKFVAVSNATYGIGFNYANFRFDYAYHQFANLPLDSSYFSLSYSPKPPKKDDLKDKFLVFVPADKSIVFDSSSKVRGEILTKDIKTIELNTIPIYTSSGISFEAESPLAIGKNKLVFVAYGPKGKLQNPIETKNARVLRLESFPDVPEGYWARTEIALISMLKIVTGYPDSTFRPEGNITRAEMAALLMRAGTPVNALKSETVKFKDVKSNHWAGKFIADASSYGVVEGYPDKTFKPNGNITRAEGLAMIARFAGITKESYSFDYFTDIGGSYWAASIISGAYKTDMINFLKGKPFEPKKKLTRAEAVMMLYGTPFAKGILDGDLLNWESY